MNNLKTNRKSTYEIKILKKIYIFMCFDTVGVGTKPVPFNFHNLRERSLERTKSPEKAYYTLELTVSQYRRISVLEYAIIEIVN